MNATKTREASVKLPIRIGTLNVYLTERNRLLKLGANGSPKTPVNFALSIESKGARRKFRKALHKIDSSLAADTMPSKPMSEKKFRQLLAEANTF